MTPHKTFNRADVRRVREAFDFTAVQMGAFCWVNPASVRRWEEGEHKMDTWASCVYETLAWLLARSQPRTIWLAGDRARSASEFMLLLCRLRAKIEDESASPEKVETSA